MPEPAAPVLEAVGIPAAPSHGEANGETLETADTPNEVGPGGWERWLRPCAQRWPRL